MDSPGSSRWGTPGSWPWAATPRRRSPTTARFSCGTAPPPHAVPGTVIFIAACRAGGRMSAGMGYVVGLPSLRLRGDYLAIVTLGFGEIVRVLLQATPAVLETDDMASVSPWLRPFHLGGALGF